MAIVPEPPAHSGWEEPCTLVTITRDIDSGTEVSHQFGHSVDAWFRVTQPRALSSSTCTLTGTCTHIINTALGAEEQGRTCWSM